MPALSIAWRRRILWSALGAAYLALLVRRLYSVPLIGDEPMTASTADVPLGAVPPLGGHPGLLMQWAQVMTHVLHLHDQSLRWIGLTCLFTAAALLWRVSERWAPGAGRWTCALFLTNPLAIQGALMICIDNTVLVLWMAVLLWWITHHPPPWRGRGIIGMGVVWFVGLWGKFSTPLLLPPILWLVYAMRGQPRRGLRDVGLIALCGMALFLAAWKWYSALCHVPYWWFITGRIGGVVLGGLQHPTFSVAQTVATRLLRLVLYAAPYTVTLWLWATWQARTQWQQRRQAGAEAVAILLSWSLVAGYAMIAGGVAGFPKYQVPLMPLMVVVSGVAVQRAVGAWRPSPGLVILTLGAAALYLWIVVGDVSYFLNHTVRFAAIFAPAQVPAAVRTLGLRLIALGFLGALVWGALRLRYRGVSRLPRQALIAATLALTALGGHVGTSLRQLTAPYATHYTYGRSLASYRASIQFLTQFHQRYPTSRLLVPWDVYYQAGGTNLYPVPPDEPVVLWDSHDTPEQLLRKLEDVDCVMVDPDYNFSYTLRHVLPDPRVQTVLARDFERHAVGDGTAWVRRGLP